VKAAMPQSAASVVRQPPVQSGAQFGELRTVLRAIGKIDGLVWVLLEIEQILRGPAWPVLRAQHRVEHIRQVADGELLGLLVTSLAQLSRRRDLLGVERVLRGRPIRVQIPDVPNLASRTVRIVSSTSIIRSREAKA
jgi:hypothetical protein